MRAVIMKIAKTKNDACKKAKVLEVINKRFFLCLSLSNLSSDN